MWYVKTAGSHNRIITDIEQARKYDVAARWAVILTDEFSNQGAMEKELNLPTCLFGGPPDREDLVKLAESQIGFMSIFAGPLFEGITAILPAMGFSTVEIESNRTVWEDKIHAEKLRRGSLAASPMGQPSPLPRTPLSVPEEEPEESRDDDIPPERDSLFGPSRTSQTQNEAQATKPDNVRVNAEPASPTSPTRTRPASATPLKSSKKKPSTGSFHGPYSSVPFHQHTNSRRSSKDAALEQLEQLQLGQLSSFSRIENQNHDGARRGSGDASLTTILVRSQTAQSKQEPDSPTKPPPSPHRQTMRPFPPPAQPGVPSSLPSSRSHATSNATATTTTCAPSPGSTRPSSVEEMDAETPPIKGIEPPPVLSTENPFLHPNSSPDLHGRERISHSAPDIRSIPDMRTGKVSPLSHVTADGDEGDDNRGMSQRPGGIRESRSRSRLRGLRFWRKRWKSPGPGAEVDTEH